MKAPREPTGLGGMSLEGVVFRPAGGVVALRSSRWGGEYFNRRALCRHQERPVCRTINLNHRWGKDFHDARKADVG